MYYSATPEFMNFCCKFIGRKITDDFVDVFVWNNEPHAPWLFATRVVQGVDLTTLSVRNYENCYVHFFREPKNSECERHWMRRRSVGKYRENIHSLTVQIQDGRIIRIFPPTIADVDVEKDETFHDYSWNNKCQLRSPTEDDMKMYAELLERCTIKGDEYDRLYVDCPLIKDAIPNPMRWDEKARCYISDWKWENLFSDEQIAERKQEDEQYLKIFGELN